MNWRSSPFSRIRLANESWKRPSPNRTKPTDKILGYVNFQTGTFRPSLEGLPEMMSKRYKAVVEAP